MTSLADTLARMSQPRGQVAGGRQGSTARLTELAGFGANPGALRARIYLPEGTSDQAPLVVVLHGCTQTAEGYDRGSGWSQRADRHGFALLFPEQQRQNNANLCFNWFAPEDNRRDMGEARSIREMIAAMVERHRVDPARIFVTGLSAGGAMTSVMLATYPEVFAGGAIIAGLPYGCASTVPQAFDRMRGGGPADAVALAALVRNASDHGGPWPTISIWHGSSDATVNPSNADAIIAQWRTLHGAAAAPSRTETVDGYPRRVWCDGEGRDVIEDFSITGMGHGTPLATAGGDGCGQSGAYMLEASISSTRHICRFWGLAPAATVKPTPRPASAVVPMGERIKGNARTNPDLTRIEPPAASGVGKVIEDALRAAGLMR